MQSNVENKSKPFKKKKKRKKDKFVNIKNERKREYGIEYSLSVATSLNQNIVYCTFI